MCQRENALCFGASWILWMSWGHGGSPCAAWACSSNSFFPPFLVFYKSYTQTKDASPVWIERNTFIESAIAGIFSHVFNQVLTSILLFFSPTEAAESIHHVHKNVDLMPDGLVSHHSSQRDSLLCCLLHSLLHIHPSSISLSCIHGLLS